MEKFDAIIIGIGQAGNPLASTLASKGLKTAVVEREHPGGSCINYGCTPTKIMIASAAASYSAKNAQEIGIDVGSVQTDFRKLKHRRDKLVQAWRDGIEDRLEKEEHITLLRGEATFSDKKVITVTFDQGAKREITADKIFINVGTSPRKPDLEGLKDVSYLTSKTIMDLDELPEHLLILGGGYIGLEFGQMYARLGSKVTILQQDSQLAPREDKDVADAIQHFMQKEGINISLRATTNSVQRTDQGIALHYDQGGEEKTINGSHLLLAIGTTPNTAALGLDIAGIRQVDHGYIEVNRYLETNQKGVFALGDCKGGPEFTHVSYDDFRIVKDYIFGEQRRNLDDRTIPYTMFTKPELGRVGLSENQAREKEIPYNIAFMPMKNVARAIEANRTEGFLKVILNPDTGTLLGATCLAEEGGELMSMLQIAMMGKLTFQQLRDAIFAHPTYAEAFNNLFSTIKGPD